jgi:hypothetical protein
MKYFRHERGEAYGRQRRAARLLVSGKEPCRPLDNDRSKVVEFPSTDTGVLPHQRLLEMVESGELGRKLALIW